MAGGLLASFASAQELAPLVGEGGASPAPWHFVGLPKQQKPKTQFTVVDLIGQRALRVDADASYGNWVHRLGPITGGRTLSWRWRLDVPNLASRLRTRSGDDSPIKVCALFDLPLAAVPFMERQVLRAARALSDEPLAAASVCYVWDAVEPAGTVLDNAFTRRVRMVVLRGQGSALARWQTEERDLAADFVRLFGDESATVPPLVAVTVSGDADNTTSHSVAYIADLVLRPSAAHAPSN